MNVDKTKKSKELLSMANNVVLIGFMGVGKGQVGRALAAASSRYVVDCDDLIESRMNLKIKKIFAQYGEKEFRKLEKKTAKWLEKNVQKTIISTGGGFVNVPNLAKIGTIVYLHAEFDYILEKISRHPNAQKKIKKRPLLADLDKAKELHKNRISLYRQAANLEIDVTAKDISIVVEEICSSLRLEPKAENF